jgi:AmmeMemoRadiSam system protein B
MSVSASDRPKLRLVDFRSHVHNGQPYYLLRDPLQLSEQMLLLPQIAAAALAFMDGSTTPGGIAAAFQRRHGIPLGAELVEQILCALDEMYLLDNERSAAAIERARAVYRAAPCRPPTIAGHGYPDDADALHQFLEGLLETARRHPRRSQPAQATAAFGLLSPHIDYPRGGSVYAQVWDRAADAVAQADVAVLFGTDHFGGDPFTLTRQSYATPYGILPTATAIVDRLAAVIGEEAAYAGELRHRSEHSLELVAVWLHHLARRRSIEVVPILVGGFHSFIQNGHLPRHDALLESVIAALREATAGRRVVVVASGDLAHVGPAFGGAPVDAAARQVLHAADQELISHMAAGDADGFFHAIHRVRDQNNVCGVAPIYLTMRLLGAVEGTPVGYAVCPADDENTSVVTVGGMVFQS